MINSFIYFLKMRLTAVKYYQIFPITLNVPRTNNKIINAN